LFILPSLLRTAFDFFNSRANLTIHETLTPRGDGFVDTGAIPDDAGTVDYPAVAFRIVDSARFDGLHYRLLV
jgi:hypothetical protein